MKAAQLLAKNHLKINKLEKPKIKDDELLVKVRAASICGTDVRMYKNGYEGVKPENPLTLGHEVAGDIIEVGSEVSHYTTGMRVAIAPNMGCGVCDLCVSGQTHLCEEYEALGINLPGGFAEYVVIPEKAIRQGNVSPIPDSLSYEEAALIEPFSCVYNGQEIAGNYAGDKVLIVGAGPIGIMHAMLALSRGAGLVIMNDLSTDRLKEAKKIVPEIIGVESSELAEQVDSLTGGKGIDLSIIAAPSPQAQKESFQYMATNGRCLFFGGLPKNREEVPLNTNILHYKQLKVFGCTRASLNSYRTSVELVASGRVPLKELITNRYSIDDFKIALNNAIEGIGLKNVIIFED